MLDVLTRKHREPTTGNPVKNRIKIVNRLAMLGVFVYGNAALVIGYVEFLKENAVEDTQNPMSRVEDTQTMI